MYGHGGPPPGPPPSGYGGYGSHDQSRGYDGGHGAPGYGGAPGGYSSHYEEHRGHDGSVYKKKEEKDGKGGLIAAGLGGAALGAIGGAVIAHEMSTSGSLLPDSDSANTCQPRTPTTKAITSPKPPTSSPLPHRPPIPTATRPTRPRPRPRLTRTPHPNWPATPRVPTLKSFRRTARPCRTRKRSWRRRARRAIARRRRRSSRRRRRSTRSSTRRRTMTESSPWIISAADYGEAENLRAGSA